jgi:hypothetical protein
LDLGVTLMRKHFSLALALTLCALPIACGDDDGDDGGGAGGSTGGGTAKGGGVGTTGGKAGGGTGGKAAGGTTGGAGTAKGGSAGEPGSNGGEPGTTGGSGGAGGEGESPTSGAGGEPTSAGAGGGGPGPTDGGAAGESGEGGAGGAPELTQADYEEIVCNKQPGGDSCNERCEESFSLFKGCPPGDESPQLLALFKCFAEAPDDDFACTDGQIGLQSGCLLEACEWDAWCNDTTPECE